MTPFINKGGSLCVGGRSKTANIPPNPKHQILFSKHHLIVKLLITDIHLNYVHCRREYTFCILRQNYCILASRDLIRKILSIFFFCKRQNAKPVHPEMANLSNIRLQSHVKPFSNTGVDYFWPIQAKTFRKTRRNQKTLKTYEVIFTCLNTRAIHIELSGDLSTDSFFQSLHTFHEEDISTLCNPIMERISSVQQRKLTMQSNLKHDKIKTYLRKHQIKWQLNSPLSAWMGGCWEGLIKTVKRCLYAILKTRITTVETLTTVLCEVEYTVNNFPLLPISDSINDYDVLTLISGMVCKQTKLAIDKNQNKCKT